MSQTARCYASTPVDIASMLDAMREDRVVVVVDLVDDAIVAPASRPETSELTEGLADASRLIGQSPHDQLGGTVAHSGFVSEQDDRRAAFEAALGSEYFALQGIRASSIAEAGTRASLFFTTLTGTVLALGFLAGSTDAVAPVAYAAMPIVVLLGLLSFFRLVEIAIEDVRALQAIQRIRGYFSGLVPEAPEFFPAPGSQQAVDQLLDTGVHRSPWRATLTIASTVGAVVSLVAGAAVAFALGDLGLNTALAAVIGVVVAAAVGYGLFRYQEHRFMTAMGETRRRRRWTGGSRSPGG